MSEREWSDASYESGYMWIPLAIGFPAVDNGDYSYFYFYYGRCFNANAIVASCHHQQVWSLVITVPVLFSNHY